MVTKLLDVFRELMEKWPSSMVAREQIGSFSGGLLTPGYMANMDSQGRGPCGRIRVGRKVAYPVNELVKWLEARSTDLD